MTAVASENPSFDRLSYWTRRNAVATDGAKVIFKFPLARCEELAQPELDEVNARVFDIIGRSWPGGTFGGGKLDMRAVSARRELLQALNGTSHFSIDTKGNLDRLVALEVELMKIFRRHGLMEGIVGWQFPIDIRVVHPRAPDNYLKRRDATDYMHCDPWRGEPDDLINVVLYCEVGDSSSQLELYSVNPEELPRFEAYTGDEQQSEFLLEGRPPVAFSHRPGQLITFDAYLPHRTRRMGDAVRISLNFSLRRLSPYAVIDGRWDRPRQAWHKFWFVNDTQATTFSGRCREELRQIAETGSAEALVARRAALEKYFGVVA